MVGALTQSLYQPDPIEDAEFSDTGGLDAAARLGTAAETPQDISGALAQMSTVPGSPLEAYRLKAQQRQQERRAIYDQQAQRLREQRVGMTKKERLLETLAAFGQPVRGGMGEALANAARVTAARTLEEQRADRERQAALAQLMAKQQLEALQAAETADTWELRAGVNAAKKASTGLAVAGMTDYNGRSVPVLVDKETKQYYITTPGGNVPVGEPGAAPAGLQAAPAGAAPAPTEGPREPAASERTAWQWYVGKLVDGAQIGLRSGSKYFVTAKGPGEPVKGTRVLTGDDALRASGGTYARVKIDETGDVAPFSEQDRLLTLDQYRDNLTSLQGGLRTQTTNLNRVRNLVSKFTPYTTGVVGAAAQYVPGSAAYGLRSELKTVIANLAFDTLAQLKQQSSTGASGLGSVTEKEMDLLKSAVAEFDLAKSDKDLVRAANTVVRHYNNVIQAMYRDGQTVARTMQNVQRITGARPTSQAPERRQEPRVRKWNPQTGSFED
jgi:hypothetical protein